MTEANGNPITPENPDAELIRLCHALPALKAAYEADARDGDDNPAAAPYHAACRAISAASPVTLPGIAAKARAAVADGWGNGDAPEVFHSDAEAWSWDVARSLARVDLQSMEDDGDYCAEGYLDEAEARAADFAAAASALVAILDPYHHHATDRDTQRHAALWCAERLRAQAAELLSVLGNRGVMKPSAIAASV